MKTDGEVEQDIERELAFDPAINAAGIGVEVHDQIVTRAAYRSGRASLDYAVGVSTGA